MRRFIGASKREEIIFVRGTNEAINLVAYAWGGNHIGPGDEIVISHLEHHANIVPWQFLSQQAGAILKVAPVDDAGNLLLSEYEDLLSPRTKLVAATQVSNALGTVMPIEKIAELGHRYGARMLIDERNRSRRLRSTCRRPARTSSCSPGTRSSGPLESARSTAARTSSRRRLRGRAAAT